ncbi:hypothetical protein MTO96_026925 [Rhipicephalus appendiculatus]
MAKALSFRIVLAVAACAIVLCMMVDEDHRGRVDQFMDVCWLPDLWKLLKLLNLKTLVTLKVVSHAVLSFINILECSNSIAYKIKPVETLAPAGPPKSPGSPGSPGSPESVPPVSTASTSRLGSAGFAGSAAFGGYGAYGGYDYYSGFSSYGGGMQTNPRFAAQRFGKAIGMISMAAKLAAAKNAAAKNAAAMSTAGQGTAGQNHRRPTSIYERRCPT